MVGHTEGKGWGWVWPSAGGGAMRGGVALVLLAMVVGGTKGTQIVSKSVGQHNPFVDSDNTITVTLSVNGDVPQYSNLTISNLVNISAPRSMSTIPVRTADSKTFSNVLWSPWYDSLVLTLGKKLPANQSLVFSFDIRNPRNENSNPQSLVVSLDYSFICLSGSSYCFQGHRWCAANLSFGGNVSYQNCSSKYDCSGTCRNGTVNPYGRCDIGDCQCDSQGNPSCSCVRTCKNKTDPCITNIVNISCVNDTVLASTRQACTDSCTLSLGKSCLVKVTENSTNCTDIANCSNFSAAYWRCINETSSNCIQTCVNNYIDSLNCTHFIVNSTCFSNKDTETCYQSCVNSSRCLPYCVNQTMENCTNNDPNNPLNRTCVNITLQACFDNCTVLVNSQCYENCTVNSSSNVVCQDYCPQNVSGNCTCKLPNTGSVCQSSQDCTENGVCDHLQCNEPNTNALCSSTSSCTGNGVCTAANTYTLCSDTSECTGQGVCQRQTKLSAVMNAAVYTIYGVSSGSVPLRTFQPTISNAKMFQNSALLNSMNQLNFSFDINADLVYPSTVTISGLRSVDIGYQPSIQGISSTQFFINGASGFGEERDGVLSLRVGRQRTLSKGTVEFSVLVKNVQINAQNSVYVNGTTFETQIASQLFSNDVTAGWNVPALTFVQASFQVQYFTQSNPFPSTRNSLSLNLTINANLLKGSLVRLSGLKGINSILSFDGSQSFTLTFDSPTNTISLALKVNLLAGQNIALKFDVLNPSSPQPSPPMDLMVLFTPYENANYLDGVSVGPTTIMKPGSSLFGVANGLNPLEIFQPAITHSLVSQSNSMSSPSTSSGPNNNITVEISFNFHLRKNSLLNFSGFQDSLTPASNLTIRSNSSALYPLASWQPVNGALQVVLSDDLAANTLIQLEFSLQNPLYARPGADIMFDSSLVTTSTSTTFRLGVIKLRTSDGWKAPMYIENQFSFTSVGQSNPAPLGQNMLNVSFAANTAISSGSDFVLTGLYGAELPSGEIRLYGSHASLFRSFATKLAGYASWDNRSKTIRFSSSATLSRCPMGCASPYNVAVWLNNSRFSQQAPDIFIQCTGLTSVMMARMDPLPGPQAPLSIAPTFIRYSMGQSTNFPSKLNDLTITIASNAMLSSNMSSFISLKGFSGVRTVDGSYFIPLIGCTCQIPFASYLNQSEPCLCSPSSSTAQQLFTANACDDRPGQAKWVNGQALEFFLRSEVHPLQAIVVGFTLKNPDYQQSQQQMMLSSVSPNIPDTMILPDVVRILPLLGAQPGDAAPLYVVANSFLVTFSSSLLHYSIASYRLSILSIHLSFPSPPSSTFRFFLPPGGHVLSPSSSCRIYVRAFLSLARATLSLSKWLPTLT